jgi:hypothetical protein
LPPEIIEKADLSRTTRSDLGEPLLYMGDDFAQTDLPLVD